MIGEPKLGRSLVDLPARSRRMWRAIGVVSQVVAPLWPTPFASASDCMNALTCETDLFRAGATGVGETKTHDF